MTTATRLGLWNSLANDKPSSRARLQLRVTVYNCWPLGSKLSNTLNSIQHDIDKSRLFCFLYINSDGNIWTSFKRSVWCTILLYHSYHAWIAIYRKLTIFIGIDHPQIHSKTPYRWQDRGRLFRVFFKKYDGDAKHVTFFRKINLIDVLSTVWIGQSDKFQNALDKYPTIHHFVTKCALMRVHFCYKMPVALWDVGQVHYGIVYLVYYSVILDCVM